jgi:hypothetical protein
MEVDRGKAYLEGGAGGRRGWEDQRWRWIREKQISKAVR